MTLLALGAKCGARAASGLAAVGAAPSCSPRSDARAAVPMVSPLRRKNCRRSCKARNEGWKVTRSALVDGFVEIQKGGGDRLPSRLLAGSSLLSFEQRAQRLQLTGLGHSRHGELKGMP